MDPNTRQDNSETALPSVEPADHDDQKDRHRGRRLLLVRPEEECFSDVTENCEKPGSGRGTDMASKNSSSNGPVYLGIGNPLLDITVPSTREYLVKYNLKEGTAVLAEPNQMAIYAEAEAHPHVEYCAGGSSMNTARALQWMLQTPGATAFVGCTGSDASAETLRAAVRDGGVTGHFMRDPDTSVHTGRCAVLITDKERTLVTHLGAAEHFRAEHLTADAGAREAVASARAFYSEGFFLTVSVDALLHLGTTAARRGVPFMFNVSAPFLVEFFWDAMGRVLPLVDYLFCNETEAAHFAKKAGWGGIELKEMARKMSQILPREGNTKGRTVVITHGAEETVVCHQGEVSTHAPMKICKSSILDTNGAGDSFVGGFVSQLLRSADAFHPDINECVAAGHYCAWKCLHSVGCRFSGKPDPARKC